MPSQFIINSCSLQAEEHESRDEERIEQAEQDTEFRFEDFENMVDEELALLPAKESKIPVSPFCTSDVGFQD